MILQPRMCAGCKNSTGVGRRTVPYEIAMDRVWDRDPDRAAPIVPEDKANAAESRTVSTALGTVRHTDQTCSDRGWGPTTSYQGLLI